MTDVRHAAWLVVLAVGACVEELPPIRGTTSLRVELLTPADPGSDAERLDDTARSVVFSLTALDADGAVDPSLSGAIDFYAHHLGSLSPPLGSGEVLASAAMVGGVTGDVSLELPRVFGPTYLWAEDARRPDATFATGTSPALWYRNPYLEDVSRPDDEAALDAFQRSPLERKHIDVTASRYGDLGQLVVTGAYAQGYTLSDVACADASGAPPCTTGAYDAVFVYTFGRPEDQDGAPLYPGHIVNRLAGEVSEFNGLTEVGFPYTVVAGRDVREDVVPEPVVIDPAWLDTRIELERVEAALVAVEGGVVCPLDDAWTTYGQWKLDVGRSCDNAFNIITTGTVAGFDPAVYLGEVVPRVVGTLRPVNIGSFHVWIIYPRDADDLTLPTS
jgi:hypothetical protein